MIYCTKLGINGKLEDSRKHIYQQINVVRIVISLLGKTYHTIAKTWKQLEFMKGRFFLFVMAQNEEAKAHWKG